MIKLGICNELFEDWDFAKVCSTVKGLGYDGLEIAPFTLAPLITDLSNERRSELRGIIADEGLETIGLHWLLARTEGFYLTSPDRATRLATGDYLRALAQAARDLGGSLLVLGSPKQRNLLPGVDARSAVGYAAEVLSRISPELDGLGVDLCFEPLAASETDFINTCDEALELIGMVGGSRVKLHLDVKAQSGEAGASVPELFRKHVARAGHVHVQDPNLRGPGMGDLDFAPIMRALVDAGYSRYASVEVFDYSPGALETARLSIACLREARRAATTRTHS